MRKVRSLLDFTFKIKPEPPKEPEPIEEGIDGEGQGDEN